MQRGFTLIETMIYLAIFSLVIGGVTVAAHLLFESSGKIQARAMLLQEEQFVMTTIERLVQDASSISVPAIGQSGTTLTLASYGGDSNTVRLSDGAVILDGSVLNNTNVRITGLSFARSATEPDRITAQVTMRTNAPNGQHISFAASTTKFLRR